jgi:hypothetical protein
MQSDRESVWKFFFAEMDAWRKRESTLQLFQQVEAEGTGKEWMHDVVLPQQKALAATLCLWGDDSVSWQQCAQEMRLMAARFRPLPVAVTRFDQRVHVAIGDALPEMPVTSVDGVPTVLQKQLARLLLNQNRFGVRPRAFLVAGSLT